MKNEYYNQQNISNNIIDNSNYYFSQEKNSYNSISSEKITTDNTEITNGIEEIQNKAQNIELIGELNLEKESSPFQINNNVTSNLHSNKDSNFSFINSSPKNSLKSGKISYPVRKTDGIISANRNRIGNGFFQNKGKTNGNKYAAKKYQSKYSSASENKNNFKYRLSGNEKYGLPDFSQNNINSMNYDALDSTNYKSISNTEQKTYKYDNSNFNETDIFSNSNQNFKRINNYNYNTINTSKLQNYIQSVAIEPKKNRYKIFTNYDILNQNNSLNYYDNSQQFSSINNNYDINNTNLGVQRLSTIGYNYSNDENSNNNINNINNINNFKDLEQYYKYSYSSPSTSTIVSKKKNQKAGGKFKIGTKKVTINKNHNAQKKLTKNKNSKNNYESYNQQESQRDTIVNNKCNDINVNNRNEKKQLLNNDVDLKYNDFDGSGFLKNYDGISLPGKKPSGETKTNQDSFIFKTNINNIKDFNIFGVMDGHGPDGHFVSEFISEIIPSQLINHPEIKKLSKPEAIYKKFKENNCKIITQAFISADKKIQNMEFDTSESGCTCCLIIHIGKHIMCANTGDSRAIVVYDESNDINPKNLDFLNVTPLSIDSKPELPKEMNRIIAAGGEVSQLKDEFGEGVGPFRVWVKGKDYPGLAMSRSIGDLNGKKIGVIPDPGILEYELNETTKFIVVCSDGVWEFLKNETVMNIGKKYYLENKASEFSHELINEALKEWEKNESIVDDITAVVAFF